MQVGVSQSLRHSEVVIQSNKTYNETKNYNQMYVHWAWDFLKLKGYWVECQDPDLEYAQCPDDMKVPVVEDSLFVPNISREQAIKLGKKYEQDAVIYSGEETDNNVELVSKTGTSIMKLGKFSPSKIAQAYTRIKGSSFTFEGFEYRPTGQMESLVFEAFLKQ
jgi:hypothetical protein